MINRVLYDYYYGQNTPAEKRFDENSDYGRRLAVVRKNQETILERLSPEDRKFLEEIFSQHASLLTLSGETSFVEGMKHGFQLALILMGQDES